MFKRILKSLVDGSIYLESLLIRPKINTIAKDGVKKKILILRKDTLGDYIIFYPTLFYYRKKYANAEITLVLTSLFKSLSPLLNDFENIIWFDAKKFGKDLFYRRSFLLNLKRQGFDIAIYTCFSRETMGDFMIKITGAKEKIAIDGDLTAINKAEKESGNKLYSRLIRVPDELVTEFDKNIYIAKQITDQNIDIKFPTIDINKLSDTGANEIINKYNLSNTRFVIFFPGSGTTFKIWPVEKFAKIADYFIEKNITPIFCGSSHEKHLIEGIISNMERLESVHASDQAKGYINLLGQTDLPTMAHLLKKSIFYFGSDTGITHLAAAIEVPTVCLLGGGHFLRFFPYGDLNKNRIVYDKNMKCKNDNWKCAGNLKNGESAPCISGIEVDDVKKEIDDMLELNY